MISEVSKADSMRYLREYIYHYAMGYEGNEIRQLLEESLQQIRGQVSQQEASEAILQFKEEFKLDEELKEILGNEVQNVFIILDKHLG